MPVSMPKILIIEDDNMLRSMVSRVLKQYGYLDVVDVADGRDGLKLCQESKFDLVITDIIMPEVDGMEVIFTLQKSFPGTRIIAMSGGGRVDAEKYLRVASAASILKKPFEIPELVRMVARLTGCSPSQSTPAS
jgi:DNA-binding response OmpR family regulator